MSGSREAQNLEQFNQIIAKLHSNESVQEGVHTAAQESDALAYIHGIEEPIIVVTLRGFVSAQSHHHVIRQLAEDEHGHDGKDHLQGFISLKVPGLNEGFNDTAVTEDHHECRHDKAQRHLSDHHGEADFLIPVDIRHAGVVGVDIGVNDLRQGE